MSLNKTFKKKVVFLYFPLILLSLWVLLLFLWGQDFLLISSSSFAGLHNHYLILNKNKERSLFHNRYSFINLMMKIPRFVTLIFPQQGAIAESVKRTLFPFFFLSFLHLFFQTESSPFIALIAPLLIELFHFFSEKGDSTDD